MFPSLLRVLVSLLHQIITNFLLLCSFFTRCAYTTHVHPTEQHQLNSNYLLICKHSETFKIFLVLVESQEVYSELLLSCSKLYGR